MNPIRKGFVEELAKIAAGEDYISPAGVAGAIGGFSAGGDLIGAMAGGAVASSLPVGDIGSRIGEAVGGEGIGAMIGRLVAPAVAGFITAKAVKATTSTVKRVSNALIDHGKVPNPPLPPANHPYPNRHPLG